MASAAAVPTSGALEELDGTPISPPARRSGWARGVRDATALVAARPDLWLFGLIAFLARGGVLLVLAPIVTLPTFINIVNTVGPTSVTAAGPTDRFVILVVSVTAAVVATALAGIAAAAWAETAGYRAAVAPDPDDPASGLLDSAARRALPTGASVAMRVATVRMVMLAPVLAAVAYGVPAYVSVAYGELVNPSNLSVPLPFRVLAGAPLPSALLVAAWLLGEVVGGLAARRVVLRGAGVVRAVAAGVADLFRAPHLGLLTTALGVAGSVLVLLPALLLTGFAWEEARVALGGGGDGLMVLVTTLILAGAWGLTLVVAGGSAAWRSALWTVEVIRRSGVTIRRPPSSEGLSSGGE